MIYYILAGAMSLVGYLISNRLKGKFTKYSQVPLQSGMTGKDVAEAMLRHYNIHDVKVVAGKGMLTDHYNPLTKTISLSEPVYGARSVAAAAVAAHECGHAVQHDTSYSMLTLRSKLVPLVKFASVAQQGLLVIALMMAGTFPSLLLVVIAAFAITSLFSFVTLPVEFDASNRALAWLDNAGITQGGAENDGAKDALWWAAMTYVAAALSSLVILVFLILQYAASE